MKALITFILLSVFSAKAGEISELFYKDRTNKTNVHLALTDLAATNSILEIGIEHTACFGACPIYTFIVRSDGVCRYDGERYAKLSGRLKGKVKIEDFNQLIAAIKNSGFLKLRDSYDAEITDNPTVYTMVSANGKRKTISDYARSGPKELQNVEKLIDDLLLKVRWDNSKK